MQNNLLLRRIRLCVGIMIFGLVVAGATAIPLESELDFLAGFFGLGQWTPEPANSPFAHWLLKIRAGLHDVNQRYPFMAYGTDWLAFGHFVIAIAFIGAWRDPARNRWLFDFGLIACGLVIPYAMIFGSLRGIPFWWRCIDCSFGLIGLIPLYFARRYTLLLEACQG